MFASSLVVPGTPLGAANRANRANKPTRVAKPTTTLAFTSKEKPTEVAKKMATKKAETTRVAAETTTNKKNTKKMTQEDSVKEMSVIAVQAFGVGLGLPVAVVGLLEATKNVAPDADVGLYGFLALFAGCGVWWGTKSAARDSLKRELSAQGLDLSTVDNIGVLKWVKSQDDLGKGRQAVDEIYKAYETESNPWSPFFKVAGVGKNKTRDLSRKNGPKK